MGAISYGLHIFRGHLMEYVRPEHSSWCMAISVVQTSSWMKASTLPLLSTGNAESDGSSATVIQIHRMYYYHSGIMSLLLLESGANGGDIEYCHIYILVRDVPLD